MLTSFSDVNLGTVKRFTSGFAWVFDHVEEAILLEYDCLPHRDFFQYCSMLLEHYRDDRQVMWMGGTNPFPEPRGDGSYFLSRINWEWGWATWRRAWKLFDPNLVQFPAFLLSGGLRPSPPTKGCRKDSSQCLKRLYAGEWRNWDVRGNFTIWANDGPVVHPNGNLISNIGSGQDARNTKSADDPLANLPFRLPGPLSTSEFDSG